MACTPSFIRFTDLVPPLSGTLTGSNVTPNFSDPITTTSSLCPGLDFLDSPEAAVTAPVNQGFQQSLSGPANGPYYLQARVVISRFTAGMSAGTWGLPPGATVSNVTGAEVALRFYEGGNVELAFVGELILAPGGDYNIPYKIGSLQGVLDLTPLPAPGVYPTVLLGTLDVSEKQYADGNYYLPAIDIEWGTPLATDMLTGHGAKSAAAGQEYLPEVMDPGVTPGTTDLWINWVDPDGVSTYEEYGPKVLTKAGRYWWKFIRVRGIVGYSSSATRDYFWGTSPSYYVSTLAVPLVTPKGKPLPFEFTVMPRTTPTYCKDVDELLAFLSGQIAGSVDRDFEGLQQGSSLPSAYVGPFFRTGTGWYVWNFDSEAYGLWTNSLANQVRLTFATADKPTMGWVTLDGRAIAAVPNLNSFQQAVLLALFPSGFLPQVETLGGAVYQIFSGY